MIERINRIRNKQYNIVIRNTDDWIEHLKQYPFLYNIKSITEYTTSKSIKTKIKIVKLSNEELNNRIKELIRCNCDRIYSHEDIVVHKEKFMSVLYKDDWVHNMHKIPQMFISRIIHNTLPTPRYFGQSYTNMVSYKYIVCYSSDYDGVSYFINRSYSPRQGIKGCLRYSLVWERDL